MSLTKTQIFQNIQDIKNDFYSQNTKNIFFKKSQKQELSNRIIEKISILDLIDISIYRFSDENRIYIDYSIIKMYIDIPLYEIILKKQ